MIVALTGGNGFLGRALRERLLEARIHVRVLTRRPPPVPESDKLVEYFQGDLVHASPADLDKFLEGARVLVHMAGMVSRAGSDARTMHDLHVEGTRKLLLLAGRAHLQRVVLLSTSGVVGISKSPLHVAREDSPYATELAERWPYYATKIAQEKLAIEWALSTGTELIALRPSLVLGPGDDDLSSGGDVLRFLRREIPVIPGGGLSFVDVRDVALACERALQISIEGLREEPRTILLGAANWSFRRFLRTLEEVSGVRGPRLVVNRRLANLTTAVWNSPLNVFRGLADLDPVTVDMAGHYWYVDAGQSRQLLDLQYRDPRQTLQDSVEYLRRTFLGQGDGQASIQSHSGAAG